MYFEFYQVVNPDDRLSRCIALIIGPETGREAKLFSLNCEYFLIHQFKHVF